MSNKFQEFKKALLTKAKEAEACAGEYKCASRADTEAEFFQVIKENVVWCVSNGVLSGDFLAEFYTQDDLLPYHIYFEGQHDISLTEKEIITLLDSSSATIETLDSSSATIETWGSSSATIKTLDSSSATIKTLDSSSATIETLDSSSAEYALAGSIQLGTIKDLTKKIILIGSNLKLVGAA